MQAGAAAWNWVRTSSRAVRDQITAMLTTAYCTAMLENRMKKFWPPPDAEKSKDSPKP